MKLVAYVEAAIQASHRQRCLLDGCCYGLVTPSDACIYCGEPRRAAPTMGVSPIAALQRASEPPSADASDPHAADPGNPPTRA
jgi:hypothetical protein